MSIGRITPVKLNLNLIHNLEISVPMTKSARATKRAPNTIIKEEKDIQPCKKVPKVPKKNALKAGKRVSNSGKSQKPVIDTDSAWKQISKA